MEMEGIKRNMKTESNSNIDMDQSVRDTDGDTEIEMDVDTEIVKYTKKWKKNERPTEFRSG